MDAVDPTKLTESFATVPLATICVVLLGAVVYLFRALQAAQAAHLAAVTESHAQSIEILSSVLPMQAKVAELGEVLERAVDRLNREP